MLLLTQHASMLDPSLFHVLWKFVLNNYLNGDLNQLSPAELRPPSLSPLPFCFDVFVVC